MNLPTFLEEGPLIWPGQHAGLLGGQHDPWQIRRDPNAADFREETLHLMNGLSLDRLQNRKSLLALVDSQRKTVAAGEQQLSGQYQAAFNLLTSGCLTQAFDLNRETATVRDRYGRHMFGQSLLLARRLVEAGVPIVQCNMGIVQTWDNHADIFNVLKNRLLPPFDQGVAALLDDLEARGLLDHTLVAVFGEFGRTPKLSIMPGQTQSGRDHWPHVFSAAFAGVGVRGGQVIGSSDATGGFPASIRSVRANWLPQFTRRWGLVPRPSFTTAWAVRSTSARANRSRSSTARVPRRTFAVRCRLPVAADEWVDVLAVIPRPACDAHRVPNTAFLCPTVGHE